MLILSYYIHFLRHCFRLTRPYSHVTIIPRDKCNSPLIFAEGRRIRFKQNCTLISYGKESFSAMLDVAAKQYNHQQVAQRVFLNNRNIKKDRGSDHLKL